MPFRRKNNRSHSGATSRIIFPESAPGTGEYAPSQQKRGGSPMESPRAIFAKN